MEGFNLEDSDPRAIEIANQVMASMGAVRPGIRRDT